MRLRQVFSDPPRFYRDGKEISASEYHQLCPSRFGDIVRTGKLPFMRGDKGDWRNETYRAKDGRTYHGRYCPQAANYPGDPKAVFPHREALVDWAQDKGKHVERD